MTDDLETARARLDQVGLEALDAAETISAAAGGGSVRELPRISIDLHSTVAGKRRAGASPEVERDLEVIATLGEGGMGRVLLARQHSLDREVAIKTLHGGASEREREALITEGAITGHLEHPSIVPVHALGLDAEGRPVLVMKRVEGVDWASVREPLARQLEILVQVCHALELAHSRHIVHRDVKPQNVLIGRYGDVYLCDWGLAVRIDRPWTGQPLCGTPGYMAPEMVLGEPVDQRTDVYLLGATLHFLLTRTLRHPGRDPRVATLAALDATPVRYPDDVPTELAELANRATARAPADRPPTVAAFRQAIHDHVQHGSSLALARSAVERVAELARLARATDEDAQHAFDRLAVEARFALEQARAQWPDNPVAARAAAELDQLMAARRARAAELERLARDLDPEPLGPARGIAFAILAAVGVGLAVLGFAAYPEEPSPERLFEQALGPLGAVLVLTALWRRQGFATVFNRRLLLTGVGGTGAIALSRALEVHAGNTTPAMLLHDSILLAIVFVLASSYLFRWLIVPAALSVVAAIIAATAPGYAHVAFSGASGLSLVLMAVLGGRRRRVSTPPSD